MKHSEFWFRFTGLGYEVVPFLFVILLLVPLALIFRSMVRYQATPESERRAELEKYLRETLATEQRQLQDSEAIGAVGISVSTDVRLSLSRMTGPWLTYYPRKWAGICGLVAVGVIFVIAILSCFVPVHRGEMVSGMVESPGPPQDGEK